VIAGGGPAGMMCGYLLARAGLDVTVLEKHADFLRDFRGDTVHPSTLEIMRELGLLQDFLKLPHTKIRSANLEIGDAHFTIGDFSRLPTTCKFIALMPQWDFLDFLAARARQLPNFHLLMRTEAKDLVQQDGRIVGLLARGANGDFQIKADLTIAADGRHSILRGKSGLPLMELGAPFDVLWLRLPVRPGDPADLVGRVKNGQLLVMIYRTDYWQCAYHPQRRIRRHQGRRPAAIPRAVEADCRLRGGSRGPSHHRLRPDQAFDRGGEPLGEVGKARALVHRRRGACHVAGGRCGNQPGDPGCGGGGEYPGARAEAGRAISGDAGESSGATAIPHQGDSSIPSCGAKTSAGAKLGGDADAEATIHHKSTRSLDLDASVPGAFHRHGRATGAYETDK
jgi:hypothetical protein